MNDSFTPDTATSQYRRQTKAKAAPRPDRFALWAVALAVVAMFAGLLSSSDAGASGAVSTGGTDSTETTDRYTKNWKQTSERNKRWARKTSRCESGGDPKAIGGGGLYRGAFQFMKSTWRTSPKTPGGDPIRYNWRTQAVVAVALKKRDGRGHWPNCG